tara:strand:+ start:1323 stop:1463 length:141 start_codon:yes stop_codon:yes gene_type:complete
VIKIMKITVALPLAVSGFAVVLVATALVWLGSYVVEFAQWLMEEHE